jgi:hypothetical protein
MINSFIDSSKSERKENSLCKSSPRLPVPSSIPIQPAATHQYPHSQALHVHAVHQELVAVHRKLLEVLSTEGGNERDGRRG